MPNIDITMTKEMYRFYLHGRDDPERKSSFKGFGSKDKIIEYVNKTFGLLGRVVDIFVEGEQGNG